MERFITLHLSQRDVTATARLADDLAPVTAQAIWDRLPASGSLFLGRWSGFQIHHLMEELDPDPGVENPTITPYMGDLVYLRIPRGWLTPQYLEHGGFPTNVEAIAEIAVYYDRNNVIFGGALGSVPANLFASITDGMEDWKAACEDIWLGGSRGETITFDRVV